MTDGREPPIVVRTATESDRETALTFILPETPRGRISRTLLRAGQGVLWVAVEGDDTHEQLVGLLLATAQIAPESGELIGYIHELLVHPAYRRRGVAMRLLDVAEHFFLDERGFDLVTLTTSPDNDAALRLYRSRGYSVNQVRLSRRRSDPAEYEAEPEKEP